MDYLLHNDHLTINASTNAAQIQSLRKNDKALEYVFQGFPDFWGWQTPTLFPFVGRLEDDYLEIDGKQYHAKQHGFARHQVFEAENVKDDEITFLLTENDSTKAIFPYKFAFRINYRLDDDRLVITYSTENTDDKPFAFSFGGHPAFNVPLAPGESFEDYHVAFNHHDTVTQLFPGPDDNLLHDEDTKETTLEDLRLARSEFANGALMYQLKQPELVTLTNVNGDHGIELDTHDFPYLLLWTPGDKPATFLCLEPWHGTADHKDGNHDFNQKPATQHLNPGESFTASYSVRPF